MKKLGYLKEYYGLMWLEQRFNLSLLKSQHQKNNIYTDRIEVATLI